MNQEQENLLFQAIGEIQGSQAAILNDLKDIKADIHQSIEKSEARQKEITDGLKLDIEKSEKRQIAAINKQDDRLAKVEEKLTNQRVKVAAMGGTAGLAVSLIAYAVKNGMAG
ncbi:MULTISPECIES: hypothetical protein [Pseudoalteromonas]|uniref:hypothetical protein n=1 Tax=Pseudoalteromonas TaxID=53246 RepID=UPI0002C9A54A|nr:MULTISPECIES: hypothetical protein [Pseudoalteromonas]ENN99780.1 hypothetical protein J139_04225 [Pseudoalteromonas agarivorans S816]MDC9565849.1 hypothetical protein [Pseudoalteromonas sp. GAB2316C]MDC9570182.1 hypothetical protein [Pseudoalteromonas sp. GABNB9D]MDC9574372.1 hypothetical protein [Pseudoalteromonas sp. GABNS16A]MDC9578707.1 hypothetical protein [Pseudoalteromonas sp. GABNS16E]|tara:strand:- start:361 stop:699 length:339 start_codon:yes stop_codon:yes gene_type:complete